MDIIIISAQILFLILKETSIEIIIIIIINIFIIHSIIIAIKIFNASTASIWERAVHSVCRECLS